MDNVSIFVGGMGSGVVVAWLLYTYALAGYVLAKPFVGD